MYNSGLVSVSFRDHSPEKIALAASRNYLKFVEWGSDVHAPYQDLSKLQSIVALQNRYGIACCSYGTYFRLGYSDISELPQYIQAAKILGTRILRLWAGRKKASDCTKEEQEKLFAECRKAVAIAEAQGVILCLECHRRSYTETKEGALKLMEAIQSPNFRMYWQPNPDISMTENLEYISLLNPYITHIHVFHWVADQRFPLRDGMKQWKRFLSALSGDHHLLLEFMPDDRILSLSAEAETLNRLILDCNP